MNREYAEKVEVLLRLLPIVMEEKVFAVFQYHLVPTFDFKQELLSRGPSMEVLTPTWFRDEIAEDVAEMANMYGVCKTSQQ